MTSSKNMKYYTKEEGKDRIICLLCRHSCKLKEGQVGICGINKNVDGELETLVYGHPIAVHVDPPMLRKGQKWYAVPERAGHFVFHVGEPFVPKDYVDDDRSTGVNARVLTAALRSWFLASRHAPSADRDMNRGRSSGG